jgi:hypothetical protein
MKEESTPKKIGVLLLIIGVLLIVVGFIVGLLTQDYLSLMPSCAIPLGVFLLFVGFILMIVKIRKVGTISESKSSFGNIILIISGILAGLFVGCLFYFAISSILYWVTMGIVLVTSVYIVFRRNVKPVNNKERMLAGFLIGYIMVFAMTLCLAPFITTN